MSGSKEASSPVTATETPVNNNLPSAVEFEPPLACVRRILKNTLPSSTNVGKDASAAFARACGIFIIYLTTCANDFAREHKRQTITANDVLAAIKELDFDEFTPDMLKFLESYRSAEKDKKEAKAKAIAEADAATAEEEVKQDDQDGVDKDEDADADDDDNDSKSATGDRIEKTKEDSRKRPRDSADDEDDSDEEEAPEEKRAKGMDEEDK